MSPALSMKTRASPSSVTRMSEGCGCVSATHATPSALMQSPFGQPVFAICRIFFPSAEIWVTQPRSGVISTHIQLPSARRRGVSGAPRPSTKIMAAIFPR